MLNSELRGLRPISTRADYIGRRRDSGRLRFGPSNNNNEQPPVQSGPKLNRLFRSICDVSSPSVRVRAFWSYLRNRARFDSKILFLAL